ncbi:unnamed protein product [Pleuronectes platessa]|uniref:Uncharacterized protein n=1 Tax=Pleuronectes platessa TaxID=8262 RepID=A0A9N7VPW1_PLEPL|nr:unnamed protein product [Pleuronectes platessa]
MENRWREQRVVISATRGLGLCSAQCVAVVGPEAASSAPAPLPVVSPSPARQSQHALPVPPSTVRQAKNRDPLPSDDAAVPARRQLHDQQEIHLPAACHKTEDTVPAASLLGCGARENTVEVTSYGVISNKLEHVQICGTERSAFCSGKP